MIPEDHVRRVCMIGQGAACCRYLAMGRGFICGKMDTRLRAAIDARTDMTAKGDNCEGWPDEQA